MSMSTYVVGFRPADEKWNEMKKVWETCEKAGVQVPKEVLDFFDGEAPGDRPGVEVDLGKAAKRWGDEYREGYEVDVSKIPKNVSIIRFYNSY